MRLRLLSFYCVGAGLICSNQLFLLKVYRGSGSNGSRILGSLTLSFYRILFRCWLELEDVGLLRKIVQGFIWNSFSSIS